MKQLRILPELRDDLHDAQDWLLETGAEPKVYERLKDLFYLETEQIRRYPDIYRFVYKGFRKVVISPFKHLLFYRIDEDTDTVVIVLLIHGARDPDLIRGLLDERESR